MNEKLSEKQNEVANKLTEIFEQDMAKKTETKELKSDKILEILEERKFDFSTPKERPEPSLEIGDHTLATNGNIMNIQAGVKAGKSAAVDAIMAAQMSGGFMEVDTFGFKALNEHGHAVIHFDTEQSRFDADALVRRSIKRSGIDGIPPSWLQSYSLADVDIAVRRASLPFLLEQAKEQHGGIFSILIDGIGDFLTDPNDPTLSFGLIDELHQLAIEYDCVIITVLHENPSREHGKTRGHLGSQLSRKAETNLRLLKDTTGITTIYSTESRHCYIPKEEGFYFHWCDESQMHVTFGGMEELREQKKREAFKSEVYEIGMPNQGKYTYTQLVDIVVKHRTVKPRSAKAYIKKLRERGGIVEVGNSHLSFNLDL